MVGLYSGIAPGNAPGMTVGEKITDFHEKMDCTEVVPIRDALLRGVSLRETIDHCRAIDDKDTRNWYKRRNLPAFTVSCLLWTRDRTVALEKKMRQYNPLIALDFDDVDDLDALRSDLRSLPWVYYAGLSVSGRGMFAVVAVDNDDCHRHKLFFQALKEEMSAMGYKVDKACSDVTRLRFVSYDPDPYFNEDCEFYSLPDDGCSDEDETDIATDVRTDNITVDERVRMYVEEWERRRVALDDYGDWVKVAMSLAALGEDGMAVFKRVSRFSEKYDERTAESVFRNIARVEYNYSIGTFYYKCHQYGVIPESVPHYESVPFPVEVFPERIREIIDETNRHQNFPVDYIAPCLLFVACMACGNSAVVELQRGWREKPLMYLAIVGGRGTNKTSCFDFALSPIAEHDNEEYEKYRRAKSLYEQEAQKPVRERNAEIEEPVFGQYILNDFTAEVLVRQHRVNPRGLIVFNDELMGFINSFNKYRSGSDEQMWTQLFAGGGVTVNRVGSEPVKINDTCIGVMGGIQPEILNVFARGKVQNGFVDRWLFAFPERVRYPKFNEEDIAERISQNWSETVRRILTLPFDGVPKVVRFGTEAKGIYKEWYNMLAEQKNNGGSRFAGIATKMDRYCARLALGLEVMKFGCGESSLEEISAGSMRGAVALCYYFLGCGLKAHKYFRNSPTDEMTELQKTVFEVLPHNFETRQGVEIAEQLGMPVRTFKRWLGSCAFKKLSYGYYEKRY